VNHAPVNIHRARRDITYADAENATNADPSVPVLVQLGPIDAAALRHFETNWKRHPSRTVDWDWVEGATKLQRQRYARLDLAVWSGGALCGLGIGKFSSRGTVLQLNFVEGAPGAHPLKGHVLRIVADYGTVLGKAYSATHFRIGKPAVHVQKALAKLKNPFTFVANDPAVTYVYCVRVL
jgi:hypothetical protein